PIDRNIYRRSPEYKWAVIGGVGRHGFARRRGLICPNIWEPNVGVGPPAWLPSWTLPTRRVAALRTSALNRSKIRALIPGNNNSNLSGCRAAAPVGIGRTLM